MRRSRVPPTRPPHPEVAQRSGALEGGLRDSRRSLEGSFEARRSPIAGHLRMRARVGSLRKKR
ncbi:hypothetical protein EBB05_05040 [Methylobacterium brachiatum]|nr:hypothetical protein EBB05_05040 [Methylobacterium brachiatum]